ncbi:MAG TPA: PilZ domain-containing protein [Terriglobales bacterium]|jgi:CheY-like chemotaxis protein|nr:PilZ domain-containing protein [Terriglobales bacterium]
MTLRALLLCRDVNVLTALPRLLERAGVQVERCSSAPQALDRVARGKYEAVVVDCDDRAGAAEVLHAVRCAPSNRRVLTLALVPEAAPAVASGLGANFLLEKPIAAERAARVLRAAYGLMMQEHRRYHRLPSNYVVHLSYGSVLDQKAVMLNLSHGGVALRGAAGLAAHQPLLLTFALPGDGQSIKAQAETTWCHGERAGVKFVKLSRACRQKLDLWLGMRLEGRDFLAAGLPAFTPQED